MSQPNEVRRAPVIPLVKYLHPDHVTDALNGRYRIGTLLEYQDAEKYPGEQQDRGEGDITYAHGIGVFDAAAGHAPPPYLDAFFGPGFTNSKNARLCYAYFNSGPQRSPDMFIFCTSHRFNIEVYNRPIYGAAVLIRDCIAFCNALTTALREEGHVRPQFPHVHIGPIRYHDRHSGSVYHMGVTKPVGIGSTPELSVPPYFVKPKIKRYEEEFEMRFAWPNSAPTEAVFIDCPEAAQFVSIFDPHTVFASGGSAPRPDAST